MRAFSEASRLSTWRAPLVYFLVGSLSSLAFFRLVNWTVNEGGAFRFKLRKMKLDPPEERRLEPILVGPQDGFYWPAKLDKTNLEELLRKRLELSKERMQRARERANLANFEVNISEMDVHAVEQQTLEPGANRSAHEHLRRERFMLRMLQERTRNFIERCSTEP
ncbi:hypothetical protein CYME_CMO085C [Cyanidioschyzon merolae strain 10D]|jgi:hypothetical protein|uniref:Uncharacterized protein n=1 Tax=Cyanidioschyzon merolae (strain NIES-3377 / 10D) TaxID=280699 RepID=M1VEV0_CYAM1|nr:hypothetical protein CYME_CMO085C [Cyanidioschyzon merolae strain 10D]BAM81462.1 hypothetical protein CYME_CMO085C [Cyanidioschyzon merolae strain 10D]|eukprot:XP_005537498.1 hypothetical protein CYME_CMO085C [Cyanidioschyzon merolae strain 10D]